MTWPLGSAPITGASSLLRASPPARPATVLSPSRIRPVGSLPLAAPQDSDIRARLLTFRVKAADRAHVASMPDTAWPVNGHPPDSSRSSRYAPVSMSAAFVTTRHQRFTCVRLPGPHLMPFTAPSPTSLTTTVFG